MSTISTGISQRPGSIPVRLAARLIDALVLVLAGTTLGKFIGFGFDWLIATAGLAILYWVLMDVCCGATLGKFVMRLRVIGPTGLRPTLRQAFIREAFTLVGAVPYIGPFLALGVWGWIIVTMRSSALRQGKHDLLAGGTRVVQRVMVS